MRASRCQADWDGGKLTGHQLSKALCELGIAPEMETIMGTSFWGNRRHHVFIRLQVRLCATLSMHFPPALELWSLFKTTIRPKDMLAESILFLGGYMVRISKKCSVNW